MNGSSTMLERVEAYLGERKAVGFRVGGPNDVLIRSFARYADGLGHRGSLTTNIVIAWVKGQARVARPLAWARRLDALRPFARYLKRHDPATQFPETSIFGKSRRRVTPHIYSDREVMAILLAARQLAPRDSLRPAAYEAFFGLIAATGLRVSEAIKLRCEDVNIDAGCLTVRMTKFYKSRHVPFHQTVAEALREYLEVRDRFLDRCPKEPFFVVGPGRELKHRSVIWTFRRIREVLCLRPRGSYPAVRIYDLRHTFICRRVQKWLVDGADIDNAMAALSTYVGHAKISDTYWYLTGTPELMAATGTRFEDFSRMEDHHV